MAIILEATYSKKLGLPNFSSHCYVVSVTTEVTDLANIGTESARLYALLQSTVDSEMREPGYVPEGTPTLSHNGANSHRSNGNGRSNGTHGNGSRDHSANGGSDAWSCSDKQRNLILKIVEDERLDKTDVEALSEQLFGIGVRGCNKMQASQLIEELLEKSGKKVNGRRPWRGASRQ